MILPKSAVLELTYRCNHKCKFCSCPWYAPKSKYSCGPELNLLQWKKSIDRLYDLGVDTFSISGGECLLKALGDKRGIERYGYTLPMDDCLCQVALDFGGRAWLVWDAAFKREKIGDMPTEMFLHFFKSFSDAAKMNLNIKAEGENEHHKIEGIFKAVARSIKMAIRRDIFNYELPSSKGIL